MASELERSSNQYRKPAPGKGKPKLFKARTTKRRSTNEEEADGNELSHVLANKVHALRMFEKAEFEVEDFMQKHYKNLNDKEVEAARIDLENLLEYCSQELHKVVHKNYKLFLDACQGVGEMEEKIQLLRNQVNGISAIVEDLKVAKATVVKHGSTPSTFANISNISTKPTTQAEEVEQQMQQLFQRLDVAVAERDFQAVRELLAVGKDAMALLEDERDSLAADVPDFISWQHQLEAQLAERKQKMIKVVERILSESTTSLQEVRSATRVLSHLVGSSHAASVMLHCHSQKIKQQQALLLKMHSSGGGDPDGTEYAGGLAQRTFIAVGRAADDVSGVFGAGCQEVQALFTVWATKEAKQCASLLRRHALSPFAAPSGLQASVQCVALAVVFCSVLEHTHGLSLVAAFSGEVLPHIEGVLKRHVRRLGEELRASAGEELNTLAMQCISQGGGAGSWWSSGSGLTLISSGTLVSEVKAMVETLQPLGSPRVAAAVRKAVLELFSAITQAAASTFARFFQAEKSYDQVLRGLAEALMRHLGTVVEAQLPAAVAPLDVYTSPLCDVEQLDGMLDTVAQQCHLV